MYELEIETNNTVKKIRDPRKAKASDWMVRCVVRVMDGNGIWHFVGHCFHPTDASWAADDINRAIGARKKSVFVDIC